MPAHEVETSQPDNSAIRGKVRDVDPATAHSMLGQGAILLDVREDDEWAAGHIDGSIHISLGELDPAAIDPAAIDPAAIDPAAIDPAAIDPAAIDAGKPVVAVCRSGNRSSQAALQLAAAGHDVVNLAGGLQEWHRQGLGLVAEDGRPGIVR